MIPGQIEYLTQRGYRGILPCESYPAGEPLVPWDHSREVDTITRVLVRGPLDTLVTALFWIDALIERGLPAPELVVPYLPGARQDRLNDSGDYLFTAKSVARMINERKLPLVITVDPHSEVMPALIERCYIVSAVRCCNVLAGREYAAVISPDAGAEKRASGVARNFGLRLIHAWKRRDVATGEISGFGVENLGLNRDQDKVLVVDDICDGGGTFLGLADLLWNHKIEADLYVTHGIFSKGTRELLERFPRVFTTDSLITDRPGITEIPICTNLLYGAH